MLAALFDVHGNLPALEAVLRDAHDRGAGRFLLGGDYAALGAWPAATIARLRELQDATWLRGNWERWQSDLGAIPDFPPKGAGETAAAELGAQTVAELAALPHMTVFDATLFCHATPFSDDGEGFMPDPSDSDGRLLAGVTQQRVVAGHTHLQFRRTTAEGIDLINPGSVGLPFDGDRRAAYALLMPDGGVELRRVEYDVERSVAALKARPEPWAAQLAITVANASLTRS